MKDAPQTFRLTRRAFATLVVGLASCTPGGDLQPLPPPDDAGYRLGAGDQVRVITYGEQVLTGQFSVDDSGRVSLPLIGPLQAGGLTTGEFSAKVAETLKSRKLIENPSVVVEIAQYRPVFVLGEVQRPGQFPFQPRMTVLAAVALAGGYTPRAYRETVVVARNINGGTIQGKAGPLDRLLPGDVITVPERSF